MSDPNLPPEHGAPQSGPPTGPYGAGPPPPGGYGAPPPGQPGWGPPPPGSQFSQPAAQPYVGGYHGPDWVPEIGRQIGSVGARIGAKAIDIVFYVVIQIVVGLGAFALVFASSDIENSLSDGSSFGWSSGDDLAAAIAIGLIGLLIDFLYNVVMVARFGGQPGKLLVGLRVVRTDGAPADMGAAFRRWSPILALSVLGFVPVAGFFSGFLRFGLLVANLIMVNVDGRRRSVFDHVGGTYVVTAR